MTNNIKTSRFNDFILLSFFPVVMIYMLLQFSGYRFEILGIYVRLALAYSAIVSFKNVGNSIVRSFLIIYIVYCVFSFVFVFNSTFKTSGYVYDMQNFLLPMLAFFIGANKRVVDDRYYKWFLYSVLFCLGLGLIFYFFSPVWYVQKISAISQDRLGTELIDLEDVHTRTRFSSFMYGPYPVQYLGISALSILLFFLHSSKHIILQSKLLDITAFFIIVLSVILCQQRTAWGYLAVLLVYYFFVSSREKKGVFRLLLTAVAIATIVVFLFSNSTIGGAIGLRLNEMSFSKAMSGRSDQYETILSNWTRPLLGHGMGSGGAIARIAGLPGVSDAGYMKILYENGMIGFMLFLGIVIPTLNRIIKNRKSFCIEMHIIIFFLIAMIGSNALCISIYYCIIFWYAIGRVWNPNCLNRVV